MDPDPALDPEHCFHHMKLKTARAEFQKLEAEGVVHCLDSPYASMLHMLEKAEGS